ncbi:hypothetical protein CVT26_012277 [Gymnopilus dilepis]|uniref:Uncharacterized protein n=1 Tax=Gymnopilus dilepis TaxID=231916 RepID=A0A409YQB2_9AGAR|nr:hypothetical protein CVT26_012277 [Gymnopilus dilepis]
MFGMVLSGMCRSIPTHLTPAANPKYLEPTSSASTDTRITTIGSTEGSSATHNEDVDPYKGCGTVQMFHRARDVIINGGQFNAALNMDIRNNHQAIVEDSNIVTSSSSSTVPDISGEPPISPGLLSVINGGQHNTARHMNIDNSQAIYANTQAFIITSTSLNYSTLPAHLAGTLAPRTIEQPRRQSAATIAEVGFMSSNGGDCTLERSPEDRLDNIRTLSSTQREPKFEDHAQEQSLPEIIRISSKPFVVDQRSLDHAILDVLSKYPSEPNGLATFKRIVAMLLFSYSPLSIGMISALFLLSGPEEVLNILRPAAQLLMLPETGDGEKLNDCRPVRFVDSKVVEFFIDRGRSGKYFTDAFTAHRTLCNACEKVKNEVHRRGIGAENLGPGWPDAYNYALLNYEDHRGAAIGTQSKL